ncbi:unknown protein [Parachlamydia acanthamoebae UV-7]|uniref:Mutator family transposase n=1 Tax=Parachlamydia acanthamoebae (strain UV7) TaxID=765952 RepID=F8KZ19_PARAV|nr:unknown protein [Parachlamydia acanthamoebae UV-7]
MGALNEEFPATKQQRCWVHKTANILDKMPKMFKSMPKKSFIKFIWLQEKWMD